MDARLRKIPKAVYLVVGKLRQKGYQAFPVGGAVRDLLLKRRISDWDIATDARPDAIGQLFEHTIPTGIEHGTVTVIQNQRSIEVTTFRGEAAYSDGRHPDEVVFLSSLFEDLKRRDFTINAMALDCESGQVIDPFEGQKDLQRGLVRAVGEPIDRFSEDGLRPLRAIRFACMLGFQVESETFRAIAGSLPIFVKVAVERIREELMKIMQFKHAAYGVSLLDQSGLLDTILPEMRTLKNFRQNRFHRYDVFTHSLKSLEKSRGDPIIRFALLLHDLGKPQTAQGGEGEYTFYGHEQVSADIAAIILKRMKFSKSDQNRIINLIKHHMFHYQPEWTDGAVRRLIRKIGPENLDDMWEMRRADIWGRGLYIRLGLKNLASLKSRVAQLLSQDAVLKISDLAIDGREVMNILKLEPGPEVGRVLNLLLEKVLDNPSINNPDSLKSLLFQLES